MSGLPREVLKWIQSLDLTWQIKTPKWDITNGYLIAEIFSWYFPQDIQMHSYNNGTSLDSKQRNWALLKEFIKRNKLEIPEEFIEGTIHCKERASALLLEQMYEILTNRKVKKIPLEGDMDFTDRAYQIKLPMHARSTACKAVKNNLRMTEMIADQNLIISAQKAQRIINDHIEHRRQERFSEPKRFNVKPSLGERSLRKPPTVQGFRSQSTYVKDEAQSDVDSNQDEQGTPSISREPTVQFKEIQVQQMDKAALYNMPIQGF
ncbi:hypothetical protein ScPMuIL_011282 [Solemya velum]